MELTPQPPDSVGRNAQTAVFRAGATGARPLIPARWDRLQDAARRSMSKRAWAYIAGGAGTESTLAADYAGFDAWRIVPRVLRDVSARDLGVELFGHHYPTPLIAEPVGALDMVRTAPELDLTRAAAAYGIPVVMSNQAATPIERVAAEGGRTPLWFQLYWSRSNDLVRSLVTRAEKAGAQAIVVTLDNQVLGWRPQDLDLGHFPFLRGQGLANYTSDPVFRELVKERIARNEPSAKAKVTPAAVGTLLSMIRNYPGPASEARAAVETFLDVFNRSDLTWDDLPFLRSVTKLPIVLKGIQHPDDAAQAVTAKVDGIIVSNHAGRQIDGAIASLDALPEVVAAVKGRIPVIFDSGVRTGADVFRALALGATAVGIGRAWAYGLAVAGEAGAREAFRNVLAELDVTVALSGNTSVRHLSPDAVRRVIP